MEWNGLGGNGNEWAGLEMNEMEMSGMEMSGKENSGGLVAPEVGVRTLWGGAGSQSQ
jgi:hypothetical protein